MRSIRLQVGLREVVPAVVRVIDVPVSATLAELHEVLQAAMGWTNSHRRQFDSRGMGYRPGHCTRSSAPDSGADTDSPTDPPVR